MYKLYPADSLQGLLEMDSDIFDLALIDPPYMAYSTQHRKKGHKFTEELLFQSREDQIRTIQECIRVLKIGSAFFLFTNWENIWWMQQPFQSFLRNMIVWDKGNWTAGDLRESLGCQHEIIFMGVKGKGWKPRGGRLADIWSIRRMGHKRIHSTEKPVALYKKIIELSTDPGAFVVDPYAGSGSSIQACMELDRHIVSWELDPDYYRAIVKRIGENCATAS